MHDNGFMPALSLSIFNVLPSDDIDVMFVLYSCISFDTILVPLEATGRFYSDTRFIFCSLHFFKKEACRVDLGYRYMPCKMHIIDFSAIVLFLVC